MKRIILFLILTGLFQFSYAQEDASSVINQEAEVSASPTIEFDSKVVDYGVIDHNSDGNREFLFTNNGNAGLLIKSVKASCGCTVPQYPKEEIAAGESGSIKVKYATNRIGKFTKTITVSTNADKKPIILTIRGEVKKPEDQESTIPVKDTKGSPLEKD